MKNNSPNWFALYVKSRAEKKVALRLEQQGFMVYCPTQEVTKQWSDRRVVVTEPLFKSYVFVQFTEENRIKALQTPGVVGLVRWRDGKAAIIPQREIEAIREFLQDYRDVSLQAFDNYQLGDEVHVKYGPMTGSYGQVICQKKRKVTLRISQLGLNLTAELPKSHLEPIL